MWKYKVEIVNQESEEYDFLYYKSRSLNFNIRTLIKQNNNSDDNNFILYSDNSLSWCGLRGYFKYNNAIDLLKDIRSISITKR
jgi:uncharacterized protein YacL (UPF0231 family)